MPDIFKRTLDKREREAGLKGESPKSKSPKEDEPKKTMSYQQFFRDPDKEKKKKAMPPAEMLKKHDSAKYAKGGSVKKKYNVGGAVAQKTPVMPSSASSMYAKGGCAKKKAK